jgi:hypothetical protein
MKIPMKKFHVYLIEKRRKWPQDYHPLSNYPGTMFLNINPGITKKDYRKTANEFLSGKKIFRKKAKYIAHSTEKKQTYAVNTLCSAD